MWIWTKANCWKIKEFSGKIQLWKLFSKVYEGEDITDDNDY